MRDDQIWFTSDLHFGHQRIIELCNRPFADVQEMNWALVQNWNDRVGSNDTVFVLGDVALGQLMESLEHVQYLNGHLLLIPGNHDRCWQGHKKVSPASIFAYEAAGFKVLDGQYSFGDWLLCHFPAVGDSQEGDRFAEHRPTLGQHKLIIHGHVHNAWKVNGRQINVGVDVWDYRPVNYEEIVELAESMPR